MTRYSRGNSGGEMHLPRIPIGEGAGVFAKARILHQSIKETHGMAKAAKALPNVGSTDANHLGRKFKNRIFSKIKQKAKIRAEGTVEEVVAKTYDRLAAREARIGKLADVGITLAIIASLSEGAAGDAAEIALAFVIMALESEVDALFEEYCNTIYQDWSAHQAQMNEGQLVITEMHIYPTISAFLSRQRAAEGDTESPWPEDTDTYEYVDDVIHCFDEDVWARAFSEATNSPVEVCEEIREAAVGAKELADELAMF